MIITNKIPMDPEQFSLPAAGSIKYIRIQAGYIAEDSVITVNEPVE